MKILHVNVTLDDVYGGGTAERTFQVAHFMARAGVESVVLTLDIGLAPERVASLAPATATVLHCVAPRYFLFPWPEPRIGELVRWADVVHLVGHWTVLNAMVFRETRRQSKPYAVCPAGALPIFGRSRHIKRAYNALIGRRMIRNADACIAIGGNEFAHFAEYGVAAEKVTLIPNGIDPADFQSADSERFRIHFDLPSAPFILFLGLLNLIKGPDLLLTAYRDIAGSFPDVHLVFAGPDSGMLGTLQQMTREFGLEGRVHFIGTVQGELKSQAYHAASVLVVPSRQEAMSLVALEGGNFRCSCVDDRPMWIRSDRQQRRGHGRPGDFSGIGTGPGSDAFRTQQIAPYGCCITAMDNSSLSLGKRGGTVRPGLLARNSKAIERMNILVVTQYFWPENFRINDLAQGLRNRGHEVTVYTGQPNYPGGIFFPGYGFFRRKENGNRIRVICARLAPAVR